MKRRPCERSVRRIRLTVRLLLLTFSALSMASTAAAQPVVFHEVDAGPGCRIRIAGLPDGSSTASSAHHANPLDGLKLSCISSEDSRVGFYGIATVQPYTKRWVLDWSRIFGNAETSSAQRWLDRWYHAQYKLIQLATRNADGFAIVDRTQTDDGYIPSESARSAQGRGPILLSFCVVHPPTALCGEGLMGKKQDGPGGDRTARTLDALRSIEFVD